MKALAFGLALISLTASASLAQTNNVEVLRAMRAREASLKVHRTLMQRIFGMNVSYGGALVPRSKIRQRPITSPGQPFENVSINPLNGRTEGITLLSIHF